MIIFDVTGFLLLSGVVGLFGFAIGWIGGKDQGRDTERQKWYDRMAAEQRNAPDGH